jgi:hypothetical protein
MNEPRGNWYAFGYCVLMVPNNNLLLLRCRRKDISVSMGPPEMITWLIVGRTGGGYAVWGAWVGIPHIPSVASHTTNLVNVSPVPIGVLRHKCTLDEDRRKQYRSECVRT